VTSLDFEDGMLPSGHDWVEIGDASNQIVEDSAGSGNHVLHMRGSTRFGWNQQGDLDIVNVHFGNQTDTWGEVDGSGSESGISGPSDHSRNPSMGIDGAGHPIVAWDQVGAGGATQIYVKQWDGAAWMELDGSASEYGISGPSDHSRNPWIGIDGVGHPIVAWDQVGAGGASQIYVKRWDGAAWVELNGSASDHGISGPSDHSRNPWIGIDGAGHPIVAWDQIVPAGHGSTEIYVKYGPAIPSMSDELDFGDAPDTPYATMLADNGARHNIAGPFMGAAVDADFDGQPNPSALGDDNDGGDDEDGVTFTTPLSLGAEASVDIDMTASPMGALLNAWIDFNGDGDWADAGEQVFTDTAVTAGAVNSIAFSVPSDAILGETFGRFRVSTVAGLSYTGLAPNGEVEDHAVTIAGGEIHGMKWDDLDGDGVWDAEEPGMGGWTIYLDENTNDQRDEGEPFDVTDVEGRYSITGLSAGSYTVAELPQPGWEQTYPVDHGDYQATVLPIKSEDISATGNVGMASYVDDGYFELTADDLAGFEFELYSTTYDHVFVSSSGLITFGSGTSRCSNSDLTASPDQAAVAAFWDDLVVSTSESPDAAVLWEVWESGDDQRLILQWHEIRYIAGTGDGAITFQAILSESDGSIQFNYVNLQTTGSNSGGASATVGIKDAGSQGDNRLLLSYNSGPNEYVASGQSVRISPAVAPVP